VNFPDVKDNLCQGGQGILKAEKQKEVSRAMGWVSTALAGRVPTVLQQQAAAKDSPGLPKAHCLSASLLHTCCKSPQRHFGVMKEFVLFRAPLIKHILYCFYFKIDYLKWKHQVPSNFFFTGYILN